MKYKNKVINNIPAEEMDCWRHWQSFRKDWDRTWKKRSENNKDKKIPKETFPPKGKIPIDF